MAKMLTVDPAKCVSCRMCEVACSSNKTQAFSSSRARLKIVLYEREAVSVPVVCYQCDEAACANVCPKNAIKRDSATNAWKVDYDQCIGCKLCVQACPFGNMTYDKIGRQVIKCDYCDGDPQCVWTCPYGALTFVEESEAAEGKRRQTASRLLDACMEVR